MDIRIDHVSKSFQGEKVLDNFSALLAQGETTSIMGPSGSGKTTLMNILLGLLPPDEGEVSGLSNRKVSVVFQEDRLCENLSAYGNIKVVCGNDVSKDEAGNTLLKLGLEGNLKKPVRELSGGMRRRVALARALLAPWDVLLMDEPFKGLDEETKAEVIAFTKERTKGKTVMLITHDREEARAMGGSFILLPLLKQTEFTV